MAEVDVTTLRKMIDDVITQWIAGVSPTDSPNTAVADKPERFLPEGKRVVRSKGSGDRVYLLDDNAKTKAWVTSPEILSKLGFEMGDVVEVSDEDFAKFQMSPSVYRVD